MSHTEAFTAYLKELNASELERVVRAVHDEVWLRGYTVFAGQSILNSASLGPMRP